jgi:ABC-type multidrug transport system ATPase subunit
MRRIPYLIGARLADWYHGRRDGQAALPDRRTAVGRITTPHRETLIRLALEVFEHERLRYERDRGDAPERLVGAAARLDQLRAHWVDANRYVAEVSRPLTDAEKTWRRLGDLDRAEPVVIQRRQTEHRQRIATARLTLDSITAEIGHVEADAAAAAETSRRSLEVATTRVLRVHEYVHRRMNSYLRTLIRWHPDGAWAGAHLTVAPDLPGWITVNAAPPEPVKLPSPPDPLEEEEEYEQPRLIDLNADGPTDFGSDPKLAHVVIADLRAAPRHFRLTRLAEDRLRLNDFGHGNGPYRFGQPVKVADLAPGDEFDFADHLYRVLNGCQQLEVTALRPVRLVVHDVCAKALDKARKQEKNLLLDMTFAVGGNTLLAVLGRSGAGKSTLLNVLIGDQRADRGIAYFTHLDLLQHSPEVADALGFVPQRTDLHTSLTTRQLLRYAFDLRMKPSQRRHREDRIEEVCEKLELSGQLDQLISTMSGGQERRVSIAAELLSRPRLLILDEPTSGLDPGMDRQIMQHLHEYAKDGKGARTVIVTTHSTSHLNLADEVLVVGEYGRPIYFGPPGQVLQSLNVTASKPVTGHKPTYADLMDKLAPWPGQKPNGWSAARAERYAGQQSVSTAKEQAEEKARDAADRFARKRPGSRQQTRLVQRPVFRRQLKTLLSRQVTLLRVRGRTGTGWTVRGALTASLPFAIAVIGAVVAAAITPDGGLASPGVSAEIALSVLTTLSVLSGQALTYGDLVTDLPVIRREYRTGTGLPAVVLSKWLVFAGMAAIQAVIIAELFLRFQPGPAYAITFLPRQVELCLDLVALTVGAMSLGLLISALAPRLERAVAYITLVSIAQIALNGVTSAVPGYLNVPALLLPDRWGLAAIASSVNLDRITKPAPQPADALWAHTPAQWLTDIIMVTALTVLYTVLAGYVLRMRMRSRGGRRGSLLRWWR